MYMNDDGVDPVRPTVKFWLRFIVGGISFFLLFLFLIFFLPFEFPYTVLLFPASDPVPTARPRLHCFCRPRRKRRRDLRPGDDGPVPGYVRRCPSPDLIAARSVTDRTVFVLWAFPSCTRRTDRGVPFETFTLAPTRRIMIILYCTVV